MYAHKKINVLLTMVNNVWLPDMLFCLLPAPPRACARVAFFPLTMHFWTPLPPSPPSGNISWLLMDPPKPALSGHGWEGIRGHLPACPWTPAQPWALAVGYVCQDCFLYSVSTVSKELLTHSELSPWNRNILKTSLLLACFTIAVSCGFIVRFLAHCIWPGVYF